ncbi:hypothetical protein SASPL_134408 [Salvia splendens]|uniref:Plastocyanin-like domain-containing protein n=1 Tax=Salvia splendens TaxID=180675 RepID=A0A8X8ZJ07_SALSN|nr:hypothetical protein SASPL_134408 [Salvia splendens]
MGLAILSLSLTLRICEWWTMNVMDIEANAIKTGGEPMLSDAYTINGQPGDFYPCSRQGVGPIAPAKVKFLLRSPSPQSVPTQIDTHLVIAASVNFLNTSGAGPFGRRFAASLNNVSFVPPASVDILQAYYKGINGVYTTDFPEKPPKGFDYTGKDLPGELLVPEFGTRAVVLEYNVDVEMVLQGTNVLASDNHPMHLHGYGFYVVGWGFGNFDSRDGPLGYNLVNPPQERHQMWGMSAVIVVKDGADSETKLLPPPHDLPSCSV